MDKEKLGQKPAFSKSAFYHPDGDADPPQDGMSKRFYTACAAMFIPSDIINSMINLMDEDMEEDENGFYIKDREGNYYIPSDITVFRKNPHTTYKIKSTYEHRLVRAWYKIVDELIKQE